MARRKSKNESALIALAIIVGLPIWIISKITNSIGAGAFIAVVVVIVVAIILYFIRKRAGRLAYLRAKYEDEAIVQRIIGWQLWQGQTMEQLLDSVGRPPSIDSNLLKTRKREVWKYHPSGKGRYRTRVTLDDDVVVEIKMHGD
ncbi:MAG: hypothetical protein ACYCPO_01600 [Acidobacteriaceae bacterium]